MKVKPKESVKSERVRTPTNVKTMPTTKTKEIKMRYLRFSVRVDERTNDEGGRGNGRAEARRSISPSALGSGSKRESHYAI